MFISEVKEGEDFLRCKIYKEKYDIFIWIKLRIKAESHSQQQKRTQMINEHKKLCFYHNNT